MTDLRDCRDPATWWPHIDEAVQALAGGGLAVLPTDTVYGLAADAFMPAAVQALLKAKGRGRTKPPPVLIGDVRTMEGLATDVSDAARSLAEACWPGPLTLILTAQPSLSWDLGETAGTVALRVPDSELARAVLRRTGPLAVSSANSTGSPPATTAADAADMLGGSVRVYLDGGPTPGPVPSTIVDVTGEHPVIVREGMLSAADLARVVPELAPEPQEESVAEPEPQEEAGAKAEPEADTEPAEAEPEADDEQAEPEAGAAGEDDEAADPADPDDLEPRRGADEAPQPGDAPA